MEIVKGRNGCRGCEITAYHVSLQNGDGDSELTAGGQGRTGTHGGTVRPLSSSIKENAS